MADGLLPVMLFQDGTKAKFKLGSASGRRLRS
jgi:hypothetical protein